MSQTEGEKTDPEHWENVWSEQPRMRLPSGLNVGVRNIQRLLMKRVTTAGRFLEIGCAPGKLLAWVASTMPVEACGLDYSARGIEWSRKLFAALGLSADLRCEDLFKTSFENGTFDYVFSAGVIEHFDDPTDVIARHVELVRPGGLALIAIPNYGGWYGRIQGRLDPENLSIHNLSMMSVDRLRLLADAGSDRTVRSYTSGRFSPWLISWNRLFPGRLGGVIGHLGNVGGLLQPLDIPAISPLLVLEIRKGESA